MSPDRIAAIINRAGFCDWRLETCGAGACQCKKLARDIIDELERETVDKGSDHE